MKKLIIVFMGVLLGLSLGTNVFAAGNGDIQYWGTASFEANFVEGWKVKVEEEVRVGDDMGERGGLPDAGLFGRSRSED